LLSFGAESFVFQFLLSNNINIKIHRTIIFPAVYRYETWSLTSSEEGRLRMFENRGAEEKNLGLKETKVIGAWGRLHNEELNDLHY